MTTRKTCDLLVVGGGPAGLSAAINAASEGLNVQVLDSGRTLGGQARGSSAIENFPGFPDGVSGPDLMTAFVKQACKFEARMTVPSRAARLEVDGDWRVILTDDYQEHAAKAVILSNGLQYRRLDAKGLGPLMGRGVYYGVPSGFRLARRKKNGNGVAVIGGANSAGQAALGLAHANPGMKITLLARSPLDKGMSHYLIERLVADPNIEVVTGVEVTATTGRDWLQSVRLSYRDGSASETLEVDNLFIFIGAMPQTLWLDSSVELDDRRFIKTWTDVDEGAPMPFETSVSGVFAAGDVRTGSTKRIAAAIGEGVGALQMVHRYMGD